MFFKTITKLLDLPKVIVVHAPDFKDGHLLLCIEFSEDADPPICSGCGATHNTSINSRGQIRVEDLPSHGRRVFLYMEKRKCRCPDGAFILTICPGCMVALPSVLPSG